MSHLNSLIKNFFFFIYLFLFSFQTFGQKKLNLQEAITLGLERNLTLRQSEIAKSEDNVDLRQSKFDIFPTLSAGTSSNLNLARTTDPNTNLISAENSYTLSGQISANVTIFQGFQKMREIKRNMFLIEADENNIKKLRNALKLQIISTFLEILSYQDQLSAVDEQYELAKQSFENDVKSLIAGKKMQADTSRAKSQILKTQFDKVNIENQLSNDIVEIYQFLDLPEDSNYNFVKPVEDEIIFQSQNVASVYNIAVGSMPEIKQAENAVNSSKQSLLIAKSAYYPTLTMSGVIASDYLHATTPEFTLFPEAPVPFFRQVHSNLYEYLSLNLNIPIFNNFRTKASVTKAKLDLETENIDLSFAKQNLYKVINQAKSDLDAASKNYFLAKQSYQAAQETFFAIEKRYKAGLSNSLDYNQAQSDMNAAQFTLIKNRYDLVFKSKVINFYSGSDINY